MVNCHICKKKFNMFQKKHKLTDGHYYCTKCKLELEKPPGQLQEKKGHNGTIRVFSNYIEIDRQKSKLIAAFSSGLHGIKRLYFQDIGSINFKKKGLAVGWIQFSVLGGRDTSSVFETIYNENAITFNKKNKEWEKLYYYIQALLDDFKTKDAPKSGLSLSDELEKAAKLLESGIITKEDFDKIKDKLLM